MKYSVRYNLKEKSSGSEADPRQRIRVRVSWASRRVEMLTGCQVMPDYWDADGQRIRSAYRHGSDTGATINKELAALTAYIDQYFAKCHIGQHTPSVSEVRQELKVYFGTAVRKDTDIPFFDCFDLFIETMREQNGWAQRTQMKFRTLENRLRAFSPRLEFTDLTEDGLQLFMRFLIKKDLKNYTIEKDIDTLRWFLRWATKKGYNSTMDFADFRPKLKGTDSNSNGIIYLEWDELMTLFGFDFGERHQGLANCRDVFCFCCFTGLRYSDAAKLRLSDIHDGYISVVTQKTSDSLRIELNDFSRDILRRCSDFQQSKANRSRKALPTVSNQKMNEYLKEIGKTIGLDTPVHLVYYKGGKRREEDRPKYELLTTHCARRTFVVNALRLGIPAEVIMKWTGHKDFKAMRPYVKIVDELKEQEMARFNLLSESQSPKSPRK